MSKIFNFYLNEQHNWTDQRALLNNLITDLIRKIKFGDLHKDFRIIIEEIKEGKTLPQLRAVHKLCDLLTPHLEKLHDKSHDRDSVKEFIKYEIKYVRPANNYEVAMMLKSVGIGKDHPERKEAEMFAKKRMMPKSFAEASKEGMQEIIQKIEEYARDNNFEGVFLTSAEKMQMLQYYRQTEFNNKK